MSAAEIIEQIKALPTEEKRRVFAFVNETQATQETVLRFATDTQASEAGAAVVAQFPEVFKRLAE